MKIYLRSDSGWKLYDITKSSEELKKRNIIIGNDAKIGNYAIIGNNAIIGNCVKIGYGAIIGNCVKIGNCAEIGDYAKIGNYVKIGYGAIIGNCVKIGDCAEIGDYAKIGNYAEIGNNAKIGDGEQILKTTDIIYIAGLYKRIITATKTYFRIGCEFHTWKEWDTIIKSGEYKKHEDIESLKEYNFLLKEYKHLKSIIGGTK